MELVGDEILKTVAICKKVSNNGKPLDLFLKFEEQKEQAEKQRTTEQTL